MSLENDPRTGHSESGFATITDSDGNTPQTAVSIPSDALFKVTGYTVQYDDSGTNTDVEVGIFDDADGTSSGNVSDQRDTVRSIAGGDRVDRNDLEMREFEEDVLVQSIGDQHDQDIDVTVRGVLLTDLKDMAGF